jgi:hypothetical protein
MGDVLIFPGLWSGKPRCESCKGPIEPRRLETIPSAKRCGPCQAEHNASVSKVLFDAEHIPVIIQD